MTLLKVEYHLSHCVWKLPKMSHFPPTLVLFKIDLSGNAVWLQASSFQKLANFDHVLRFSNTVLRKTVTVLTIMRIESGTYRIGCQKNETHFHVCNIGCVAIKKGHFVQKHQCKLQNQTLRGAKMCVCLHNWLWWHYSIFSRQKMWWWCKLFWIIQQVYE